MEPLNLDLLTVAQTSARLGVTVSCIRRWISERRIAVIKLGRLVRVPSSELVRIIEIGHRPAAKVK
jgi:excisionase family DNA binding protein